MSSGPSSSNREGGVCDAMLVQQERQTGPLRLPRNRADDFIALFNRIYKGLGMKLEPKDQPNDDAADDRR